MKSFLKYWLPVFVWLALIFIGSTDLMSAEHTSRIIGPILRWFNPAISAETIVRVQFFVRKAAHLTEYAILAMLIWRALRGGRAWSGKTSMMFAVTLLGCALFAASDEFHQSFVPTRTASSVDIVIDICGAAGGVVLCWLVSRRKSVPVFASSGK